MGGPPILKVNGEVAHMIFNRHFYRSIAFWLGWGFIGLNVWLGWPVQETKVMWWGMLGALVIGVVLVVTGLLRNQE